MDALLSYLLFKVSLKVMFIEFAVMFLCCLLIAITKLTSKRKARVKKDKESRLSNAIEAALFPSNHIKAHFVMPPGKYKLNNFIEVLESFEQRFTDDRWEELKNEIVDQYVLANAKKNMTAKGWISRQLAARALLLCPKKATEEELSKLIQDPRYLVRVVAAVVITKTSYPHLFYEMIQKMSQETELSQFFYRDALVQSDQEKFHWMEDLLKKEHDPKIIAVILDILSTRSSSNLFPIIKPFTNAADRNCRILAVKAIGNISSKEAIDLLVERLEDSDWEVRAASIQGIKNQHVKKALPKLGELLNDPIWWVRLQAANALKGFDAPGKEILQTQDIKVRPLAHEIAEYALSLPY